VAAIEFDGVWKKFRRGEQHDSLRDLIPSMVKGVLGRSRKDDLDKNDFWVLRDVSFKVERGEALGIIGQNGAGKSTTLKLLTKILKPTRGSCHVRGRVGALIEIAAGFHPDLTGRENVFLQGAIMGMRREEIRRHFDEIVEFAQLAEFIDTPVKRYSSGMNARLGFAIAAHLEPDVLLIDEVLAVGDFSFQQKCYERLREFRRKGSAIAFVSHNMQAVASLCERGLLLRPNATPILDDIAVVTAAYAGGGALPLDPRVVLHQAALTLADGSPLPTAIAPGERLALRFELGAKEPLPRAGVLLQIVRSDGVAMFAGMSTLDGMEALSLDAGSALGATIDFTPNVLRGTYAVNVQLVDDQRIWSPVILNGMASFVVAETTRAAGCAEVFPRYHLKLRAHDAAPFEGPVALVR
jgi:lipopolysaccharide transport system ATP-binding protein